MMYSGGGVSVYVYMCKEASYIDYVREERSKNLDRVGRKVPRHVQHSN